MNLQYDMHTHILPTVDDGAKSVEDSLKLINRLSANGVKYICLTPHFYTHKESIGDFLKRRDEAYNLLKPHLNDDIKFCLGAEVYVTKYLFLNEEDLKSVCYEGTNYMLTEFSYSSTFRDDALRSINKLMSNYGIQPVLAHVERYPYLMKHPDVLEELIYMGVIIQSNACSFSEFPLKFKLTKMIKNGYVQAIGSDTHSLTRNAPDAYGYLSEMLNKKASAEIITEINNTCAEILN